MMNTMNKSYFRERTTNVDSYIFYGRIYHILKKTND